MLDCQRVKGIFPETRRFWDKKKPPNCIQLLSLPYPTTFTSWGTHIGIIGRTSGQWGLTVLNMIEHKTGRRANVCPPVVGNPVWWCCARTHTIPRCARDANYMSIENCPQFFSDAIQWWYVTKCEMCIELFHVSVFWYALHGMSKVIT